MVTRHRISKPPSRAAFSGPVGASLTPGSAWDEGSREGRQPVGDKSYLRLPSQSWRTAFAPRGPDLPDEPPRPRRRRWWEHGGDRLFFFLTGLLTGFASFWGAWHLLTWLGA